MKGILPLQWSGQWTPDKNGRKYRHMSVIPFPVCAYATIHYKERRQMDDWIIQKEDDYKIEWNKIR